ncbi:hypothetical protein [Larkinella punicea]|uniref:Uncharacterized protein n=1 Tax=Larkinella punicea TaxID=2315727 RepID=A0A368JLF2_9BACT|nr:hypothetical protein [Larkinella punicea]RCR66961.1 hypothetical protein DUE52_24490 [Larkinella punicea]
MKFPKQYIALLSTLMIVYLYTVFKHQTESPKKEFIKTDGVQEKKYYENLKKIDALLLNLTKEAIGNEDGAIIQNTFLDLRQEWIFQDVLAETTKSKKIQSGHYPSDSLKTIYHLLFPEYNYSNKEKLISEIKRIKKRILEHYRSAS